MNETGIDLVDLLCEKKNAKEYRTKQAERKKQKCRVCGKLKPLTEFHKCSTEKTINGKFYPATYRTECKTCRRVGGKAHSGAAKKLMEKLGMKRPPLGTPCDNCGKTDQKLIFDHCHKAVKFRGWLCYQCNTAIGNLGDDIEFLERAIRYLKKVENLNKGKEKL